MMNLKIDSQHSSGKYDETNEEFSFDKETIEELREIGDDDRN
jgi:hypothetical protein